MLKNKFLSRFTLNFGIYFVSTIISKFIPFLILPVITRILIPVEYGKWSVFSSVLAFTIPFAGLMMRYHLARSYYRVSKQRLGELLFNMININILSAIVIFLISLGISLFYREFIFTYRLYLIPALALLTCISEYFTTILRYEKKPVLYSFFEIGGTLILWGLAVLLIISDIMKWEGMLVASLVSSLITSMAAILYLKSRGFLIFKYSASAVKESLKIGIPLLPHAIGGSIIAVSDRLILMKMTTVEIVGVYAIGYSTGMAVNLFVEAFNKNWGPWMYEKLSNISQDKKRTIVFYTYIYYAALAGVFAAVLGAGYAYIKYLIDPRYINAVSILFWSALAGVFRGMYVSIFPYMTHLGRTYIYSIITFTAGLLNILLTIILVKLNGMTGAAQATAAAFFFMFISLFICTYRYYPMPWLHFTKGKS